MTKLLVDSGMSRGQAFKQMKQLFYCSIPMMKCVHGECLVSIRQLHMSVSTFLDGLKTCGGPRSGNVK